MNCISSLKTLMVFPMAKYSISSEQAIRLRRHRTKPDTGKLNASSSNMSSGEYIADFQRKGEKV